MDFKGQVALVTGGARGIGRAIAENLAKKGVNLAVADVSAESAAEAAKELASLGVKTSAVKMDVSKAEQVEKAFRDIVGEFGRLDILVNNAGITKDGLLMRMKEEDWDAVIDINLKGVFLCAKEAVKAMAKQ